jgi:hypothetical protein
VDQAVFGMLAVLDGSRSLGAGVEFSLQESVSDHADDHSLHDIFRGLVDEKIGYD